MEYNGVMDHLVLINSKEEIESLASGQRSMMVYGVNGARGTFCDIHAGDKVFFTTNNGAGFVVGQALVKDAFSTKGLRKKPATLLAAHRKKLNFNDADIRRWSRKQNIMFVELSHARQLKPFAVSLSGLSNVRPLVGFGYLNQIRIN